MNFNIIIVVIICLLVTSSSIGVIYYFMSQKTKPDESESQASPESTSQPTVQEEPVPVPVPVPVVPIILQKSLPLTCEGVESTLSCPNGIKSGNIKYGRWDNNSCVHPTVSSTTPSKIQNYELPQSILGKNTYTGTIHTLLNSDPYPGVYKQYTVDYTCN